MEWEAKLEARKAVIKADLLMKIEHEDWHGVQDCASDIREIDAMMRLLLVLDQTKKAAHA